MSTISSAAAKNWVKIRAIQLVAYIAHTKIGSRPQVIPGARRWWIVTRKFRPPRIDDSPKVMIARLNRTWPAALRTDSGGYAVQPESQPPTASEARSRTATGGTSQNVSALRRG